MTVPPSGGRWSTGSPGPAAHPEGTEAGIHRNQRCSDLVHFDPVRNAVLLIAGDKSSGRSGKRKPSRGRRRLIWRDGEEQEFFTCEEFVYPDDRPALEETRQKRALQVRAEYLTEIRNKAGLTQAEVAEAMGVSPSSASRLSRAAPSPNSPPWPTASAPLVGN